MDRLLGSDDPPPYEVERGRGSSLFLLACDHAGRDLPARLGTLGLDERDLERHIAWDIGAGAVARMLSRRLDATLVRQRYSRLVIDCNRPPDVATSIATVSEDTAIPGNVDIPAAEAEARAREIFRPYHQRIAAELDARAAQGRETALVTVHSFTPVFKGFRRPWHAGIIYGRDRRLAEMLLALLREEGGLTVGDNEPFTVSDATDYTIPVHGERRGLPHVQVEIRQDLVAGPEGQAEWAGRLARLLPEAYARLAGAGVDRN